MTTTRTTQILLLVALTIVLGWEVYVVVNATDGDTISEVTKEAAKGFPLLPYLWGVLAAHLFSRRKWRTYGPRTWGGWRYLALLSVTILVLAISYVPIFAPLAQLSGLLWVGAGFGIGFWLWPQFEEER